MILEAPKKTIKVVAAVIIVHDKLFAAQRDYGDFKGDWEFPGGKVEQGETDQEALIREIKEELNTEIVVGEYITNVVHEYPKFILDMNLYRCTVSSGRLEAEKGIHSAEGFFTGAEARKLKWCPADQKCLDVFFPSK